MPTLHANVVDGGEVHQHRSLEASATLPTNDSDIAADNNLIDSWLTNGATLPIALAPSTPRVFEFTKPLGNFNFDLFAAAARAKCALAANVSRALAPGRIV